MGMKISYELVLMVLKYEDHLVKISTLRNDLKERGRVDWEHMNEREEDLRVLAAAVVDRLNEEYGDRPARLGIAFIERVLEAVFEVDRERYVLSEMPEEPETAWDFHNQGNGYDQIGDFEKALASFSRAVELDPAVPAHFLARARFYWYRKRDASQALVDVERALTLVEHGSPLGWTHALSLKATVLMGLGRLKEAIESIRALAGNCKDLLEHLDWDEDGWGEIDKDTRISGYYIAEIVDEGIDLCEAFVEKSAITLDLLPSITDALREFRRLRKLI